jgi:catechol 2,3-dioxygenase-like lactoylglutathione lyase family enzyme
MAFVSHIDHVAVSVRDLDSSVQWYQAVLKLEMRFQEVWKGEPVMLCAGDTCLALFQAEASRIGLSPDKKMSLGLRHIAFRVSQEGFQKFQTELRERGIVFRFEDHEVSHSIYFSDPDGHQLEITTYEID